MSSSFAGLVVLLIGTILFFLLFGFFYLWLYIAKKENLLTNLNKSEAESGKRKRRTGWVTSQLLRAGAYIGPTAIKYPLFTKPENDELALIRAGNPHGMQLEQFYGIRYLLGFGSLILFFFGNLLGLPYSMELFLIAPVCCFLLPNLWIHLKAKKRQEEISVSMPEFLDTMSVTLQAGVSLDGALKKIVEYMDGPLSEEIQRLNQEIGLGVPRRTALENLVHRNSSRELELLVHSLLQGLELGVPVSTTFRIQADELRASRGFRAREQAAKASPKITLVTVFMVTPAVFVLIVGLIILNVIYSPEKFGLNGLL
jgi:tight adherence protein C